MFINRRGRSLKTFALRLFFFKKKLLIFNILKLNKNVFIHKIISTAEPDPDFKNLVQNRVIGIVLIFDVSIDTYCFIFLIK